MSPKKLKPISPFLIKNLESEGVKLEKVKHRKVVIGLRIINIVDKLKTEKYINESEYLSLKDYQKDYELSNKTNHAKPNYNNIITNISNKPIDRHLKDSQIKSSIRVDEIKRIIKEKETRYTLYVLKTSKRPKKLKLSKVLQYAIEQNKNSSFLRKYLKLNDAEVKKRIKIIAQLIITNRAVDKERK